MTLALFEKHIGSDRELSYIPRKFSGMKQVRKALQMFLQMALILLISSTCFANPPFVTERVVVKKSARKLFLYQGDQIIRAYDISLGKNPVGHKQRCGDCRTPEGRYLLDWRNPSSRFHLSIHISYPDPSDKRRARERGISPGGNIMIHGLPNRFSEAPELFEERDWTDGCIAVTNEAMEEIWHLVANNTPIEIYP
jgi:murein L,D-transpeptidase YafK